MPIHIATALKGISANPEQSVNPVYRGEIVTNDGKIHRAFLKDLDPRQIGNELLVTALADNLGIVVPDAAIVFVPPSVSTQFDKIPSSQGVGYVAYASIDAEGSTVAQVYKQLGALDFPLHHLRISPVLGNLYGLDTWVANVDRHAGNLIVRGDGQVFLIDHGYCLSGPSWSAGDLHASKEYRNVLRQWLTPRLTSNDKDAAMADIKSLVGLMTSQDIEKLISDSLAAQLFGANDTDAVVGFLENRVQFIETLSAQALDTL